MTARFNYPDRSAPRFTRQWPRMARARKSTDRGVALLMVTGAIVVLMVMLVEFQDSVGTEVAAATAARDSLQAEYMARSAVNLSRLLIATEPTIRASVAPMFALMKRKPPQLPVWEFSDRLLGAFSGEEGSKDFASTLGFDAEQGRNLKTPKQSFELVVVDEDSKINANQGSSNDIARIRLGKELMGVMTGQQYNPLFEQKDVNGQFHERRQICQSVIDWADVDDQAFNCDFSATAQSAGAEDVYYSVLAKPYKRKNAPFDSLDELRMVRGFGDDFWATFVEPDVTNPKKRVMTVWGQGAVNVNTAPAQVLYGVVCAGAPAAEICVDPAQASMFLMGVTMARGASMGAPMFGSAGEFVQALTGKGMIGPMLATMGMKPVKFQSETEFAKSITTESKVFSVYAVGIKAGYKRESRVQIHAVVDFRTAPALGANSANALGSTLPTAGAVDASKAAVAAAFPEALKPSAAGQVVYYHVQ
jgi:general secretion pathway protein K